MKVENVKSTLDKNAETYCPACGHFAGTYENCPRCGTFIPKRMSIKVFKYMSVILAVVGLICVYGWVISRQMPVVKVKDVKESMNFGYVRVEGIVKRGVKIYYENEKPNYLNFSVNDGTGEIRVAVYKHNAQKMIARNIMPRRGDNVSIQGQLRVKPNDDISLILQAVDQLKIIPAKVSYIPLGTLNTTFLNKEIAVKGKIVNIRLPRQNSRGPVKIQISQGTSQAQIVVWQNVYQELLQVGRVKIGLDIIARVQVSEYRNAIQLRLAKSSDFTLQSETNETNFISTKVPTENPKKKFPIKKKLPNANKDWKKKNWQKPNQVAVKVPTIATLSKQDVGKRVTITAVVVSTRQLAPGLKVLAEDRSGKIALMLWNNIFQNLEITKKVVSGAKIKVTGIVALFRERLQLQPQISGDLVYLGTREIKNYSDISQITKKHIGEMVKTSGKVIAKRRVKPGFKVVIVDNKNNKIGIMLWDRIFKDSKIPWEIAKDGFVSVTGKVSEHRNRLQVQPQKEADVKILKTAPQNNKNVVKQPEKKQPEKKQPVKKVENKTSSALLKELNENSSKFTLPEAEKNLKRVYLDFVAYLKKEHVGKLVQFKGVIQSKQMIPPGMKFVFVDRSGRMDLILRTGLFKESKLFYKLGKGFEIRVKAKVSEFAGKLQLLPRYPGDITILSLPKPKKKKSPNNAALTKAIQESALGKVITVRGKITYLQNIKLGKRIVLEDNSGKVDVILLKTAFANSDVAKQLTAGKFIEIQGTLSQFRKRFEIKLSDAKALKILDIKPVIVKKKKVSYVPKNVFKTKDVKALKDKMDTWTEITGKIISSSVIPPGLKYVMLHATGRIELIVRNEVIKNIKVFSACKPGSILKVVARVSSYRGRTQLELGREIDFIVVKKADLKALKAPVFIDKNDNKGEQYRPIYNLSNISKAMIGARILLTGKLKKAGTKWAIEINGKQAVLEFSKNIVTSNLKENTTVNIKAIVETNKKEIFLFCVTVK